MSLAVSAKSTASRRLTSQITRTPARVTRAVAPRASRKPVAVHAFLGDLFNAVGNGFVRIFSPAQDNGMDWKNTTTPYKGRVDRSRGQPFSDGYQAGGVKSSKGQASATAVEKEQKEGNEVMTYVGEALERVVGHNFKGDGKEPPSGTGSAGWKGDIHSGRRRDGFHSQKL